MMIQINFKSGKPVYLQVVDQIKAAAASGAIKPGEPLPTIRPLSEELRLNRNTIAKAYAELENQGVIETQPPGPLLPRRNPYAAAECEQNPVSLCCLPGDPAGSKASFHRARANSGAIVG